MKKIILFVMLCMALLSSGAFAMTVEHLPYFDTYTKGFFSAVLVGHPIDDSSAGFSMDFYSNVSKVITLNSPDATNPYWWVWVSLHNTNENTSNQIDPTPHDMSVYVLCGGVGGWFNLTNGTNYTWSNGYSLFKLTWDTEEMIPVADMLSPVYDSPTGLPLYIKQRDCVFGVDDASFVLGDWATMKVWAQNPEKNAVCGVDEAVVYLQTATVTIVDINLQVWQILFQIFSIVVILLAIFGIPLLLFKLMRWLIEEVRGKKKLF